MKLYSLFLGLMFVLLVPAFAQDARTAKEEEAAYVEVVLKRADKIVAELTIADAAKLARVRDIIAQQYQDLRNIQDARDAQIESINKNLANDIAKAEVSVKKAKAKADAKIAKLHKKYLSRLSAELTAEQIDVVKNGMTYNACPITYKNYLAMLPDLTEEQKTQIWAWLIEAREHAMDGGSSKEKLAWFGKYKGKITNYLTAAGYDLKQLEADWLRRVKAETSADKIMESLDFGTASKNLLVRNLIKQQYYSLADIHEIRDMQVKIAKRQADVNKEASDAAITAAWTEAKAKLDKLHAQYLSQLSAALSPAEIVKVKDAMTENGLQKDYSRFTAMLPELTEEQKAKVMAYLVEARENAMSAGSSKEIHQWFAKYRGRANNYLSAEGYDLRKATEYLKKKQEVEAAAN